VVTSISWISTMDDAKESLLRTRWDLVIVDEAHKMSPTFADKPTLAFQIGEELSQRTDHFLLMTATPHKGDPEHFRRFLTLLDKDVYADIASLQQAVRERSAPFYLRRVKEALRTFPDPETGIAQKLFVDRDVSTSAFSLGDVELAFYDALTTYVSDQSARAAAEDSPAARAMGFPMAMLVLQVGLLDADGCLGVVSPSQRRPLVHPHTRRSRMRKPRSRVAPEMRWSALRHCKRIMLPTFRIHDLLQDP
jgi:hypothetical protein